jgi:hypothetical protein
VEIGVVTLKVLGFMELNVDVGVAVAVSGGEGMAPGVVFDADLEGFAPPAVLFYDLTYLMCVVVGRIVIFVEHFRTNDIHYVVSYTGRWVGLGYFRDPPGDPPFSFIKCGVWGGSDLVGRPLYI